MHGEVMQIEWGAFWFCWIRLKYRVDRTLVRAPAKAIQNSQKSDVKTPVLAAYLDARMIGHFL